MSDIDAKSRFHRTLSYPSRILRAEDREVQIKDLTFELEIRLDPQGYLARYDFQALAQTGCVRCNEPVDVAIKDHDWIALRLEQPQEHHVILKQADMNTQFLTNPEFDVESFVDQVVDLAVPEFPRHADCLPDGLASVELNDSVTGGASPFASLAHLLEQQEENQGED